MKVVVKTPFVGHGFNMPDPRTVIDVREDVAQHLISMGACVPIETKIERPPLEVKKNEPSESSQAAPAPRKKTRKRSKRSATKS